MVKDLVKNLIKSFQDKARMFLVPFFVCFFITVLLLNWNEISWILNYKAVYAVFYDRISGIMESQKRNDSIKKDAEVYLEKEDSIEIQKIGVFAPIQSAISEENKEELDKALKNGVLLYPNSVLPGQRGKTIILGHSAPASWPNINYDHVFSHLDELVEGDEVVVYYNHLKYVFKVKDKQIFFPAEEEEVLSLVRDDISSLVLVTCWPPGKDYERLAVFTQFESSD